MITINLCGGLGNQLFQIFTTISHAMNTNNEFLFLYSEKSPSISERKTYWDKFLINLLEYTTFFENNKIIFENNKGICIFRETSSHSYCEIPKNIKNLTLDGYFQSYKYFENNKNKIFGLIGIERFQKKIKNNIENFFTKKTISIHFRLGDYKHLQHFHTILPLKYYENCLKKLDNLEKYNILIFCEKEDDEIIFKNIEFLKNIFQINNFIKVPNELDDWEQIIVMSLCDINIIANSTFSWWGAYFNNNPLKKVYYPSSNLWFANPNYIKINDTFPSEWVEVDGY